jgi:hypothetical protein
LRRDCKTTALVGRCEAEIIVGIVLKNIRDTVGELGSVKISARIHFFEGTEAWKKLGVNLVFIVVK